MARRGRGEGTIRQRRDGRWEAAVTLGSQRKSFYSTTRREVTEKLRKAQREFEETQFIGESRQTVQQYVASWLESKADELKASTLRTYDSWARTHLYPVIGSVKLTALTAQHVQRVITVARASGLAASSVNEVYGLLHEALATAVKLGLVARDVSARVDRPRAVRREMRPLSTEEANHLLDAARGDWLEALYRLAVTTGMREGELLGLTWRAVELDRRRLSVVATMSYRAGVPVYTAPKTRRSRRQIALSAEMVEALRHHRRRQQVWRVKAGPAWQGERYDAVFTDELGDPLRRNRVVRCFKRLLATVGLPAMRFHDLRHTCATLLLAGGVHPKVVSDLLGHSTVSITLDIYSHVLPHLQEEAARAMGDLLHW